MQLLDRCPRPVALTRMLVLLLLLQMGLRAHLPADLIRLRMLTPVMHMVESEHLHRYLRPYTVLASHRNFEGEKEQVLASKLEAAEGHPFSSTSKLCTHILKVCSSDPRIEDRC